MSKEAKVKISKLVLEIGGKKIEITIKQAQELREVLNDSFAEYSLWTDTNPTLSDDYTTLTAEYTTSTAQ